MVSECPGNGVVVVQKPANSAGIEERESTPQTVESVQGNERCEAMGNGVVEVGGIHIPGDVQRR